MTASEPYPAPAAALHADCLRTLSSWSPPSADQAVLRQEYLDYLATHLDGWSRSSPEAHLTASSLICSPDGTQVLLTLHARLGRWLQTGGHLEATDNTLVAAVLREAREESGLTGLQACGLALLATYQVNCGPVWPCSHLDVQYVLVADPGSSPPRHSQESLDVRWFDRDQLPDVDASLVQLIEQAPTLITSPPTTERG